MVGIDLERAIAQLMRCELLSEAAVKEICEEVQKQLLSEANVIIVHSPVTIVGDLHGFYPLPFTHCSRNTTLTSSFCFCFCFFIETKRQFHDLLELFKVAGQCPDVNYLFLGNYVNRGYFSVETMSLITCLKLRYPERIHLLRGNHESRPVTRAYGFYGECMRKYGNTNVWRHFTDLFDFLPLAAVINKEIFAVHAGIPPALTSIDQLRLVDRFKEVSDETFVVPLLWSVLNRQKEAAIQILRFVCLFVCCWIEQKPQS